jgi:hypothetical protein
MKHPRKSSERNVQQPLHSLQQLESPLTRLDLSKKQHLLPHLKLHLLKQHQHKEQL